MSQDADSRNRMRRVDVGDITLIWGDKSDAKAELRAESERRYRQLSVAERLRIALSMVVPRRKS